MRKALITVYLVGEMEATSRANNPSGDSFCRTIWHSASSSCNRDYLCEPLTDVDPGPCCRPSLIESLRQYRKTQRNMAHKVRAENYKQHVCHSLFEYIFDWKYLKFVTERGEVVAPYCTIEAMQTYFSHPSVGLTAALHTLLRVPSSTRVYLPDPHPAKYRAQQRIVGDCGFYSQSVRNALANPDLLEPKLGGTLRFCSIELFEEYERYSSWAREGEIFPSYAAAYLLFLGQFTSESAANELAHLVYMATQGAFNTIIYHRTRGCEANTRDFVPLVLTNRD